MTSNVLTLQKFLESQALLNGPEMLDPMVQYALFRKTDTPLLGSDFFVTTYGAKVWDTLNNQTRFWNLIRKVPWGARTGWRNRASRTGSTGAIAETGAIGDYKKSTYQEIFSEPRSIVTPFSVTAKAQFLGGLEGGIGDALATEQEGARKDHVKWINEALLKGAHVVVTTAGASGTAAAMPKTALLPGDRVYGTGAGGADTYTITLQNITTGVVTFVADGAGGNWVDGNEMVIVARLGPTSLDDVVEEDGRTFAGANSASVDVYNLTTRTAGGYAAAGAVLDNNGTLRDVSLPLLDEAIRKARDRGAEPDLILTGTDQLDNIASLLEAQHRYMGEGEFTVKMGDEVTLPGFKGGFTLATYKGIPIFPDIDCPFCYQEDGTLGGSKLYVLDTRFIEIAVATMTQYLESRDYIANDTLAIKSLFWTMFELRCNDITKQTKIEDLNASIT